MIEGGKRGTSVLNEIVGFFVIDLEESENAQFETKNTSAQMF